MNETSIVVSATREKDKRYTRRHLQTARAAQAAEREPDKVTFRPGRRWQKQDAEMRRMTEGTTQDFRHLP